MADQLLDTHTIFEPSRVIASDRTLFDKIDWYKLAEHQEYDGTLGSVLTDLTAMEGKQPGHMTPADRAQLIFGPARVMRGVLAYKIDHPDLTQSVELVEAGIDLIRAVYGAQEVPKGTVAQFRQTIVDLGGEGILTTPVIQPSDDATCVASAGERTRKTAQKLDNMLPKGQDTFEIVLANGGVPAGVDLHNRFSNLRSNETHGLYIVRHSMTKSGDSNPQLTPDEITHIQEHARGKQVVVFTEDQNTGRSLARATGYFEELLPDTPITPIANASVTFTSQ